MVNMFHLEYSRYRSSFNGFANMIAAVIAYALYPNKSSLQFFTAKQALLLNA